MFAASVITNLAAIDRNYADTIFYNARTLAASSAADANAAKEVDLFATGDCGWMAPEHAPTSPTNAIGGKLIKLVR